MKNGVDHDVALALYEDEAMALSIVFHEQDSAAEFDWDAMSWNERK